MSHLVDAVQGYDTAAKVVIQRFPFRSICSHNKRDRKNEDNDVTLCLQTSSFRITYLATDKSDSLENMEILTKATPYYDSFDYHLLERMNRHASFLQLYSNKWVLHSTWI